MNLNKTLKALSIVFESSFAGSVILYIYNYYVGSKKYEVIPEALQKNLDIFLIIAIVSIILFIVLKYIMYLRCKEEIKENKEENKYKNLEESVTERVIIYKDSYDVPKEKRMICPNCNNIIDKNAYICIKCGYLLKPIVERVVENHYNVNNNTRESNRNYNMIEKKRLISIIVNVGLILAIVVCLLLIINMAMERGIIG